MRTMIKPMILTGLRANGEFHIGNYLGAILPMVQMQRQHAGAYQINMFIPDLHSFTTPVDHNQLIPQTLTNLKVYAAAGLDLSNTDTYIYRHSYLPAHSELAWILGCFTYFGELSRMTQFKDKSEGQDKVSVGLFTYPVLMAADILIYDAKYVPLGDDQQQHLELARDVAIRMNSKFGPLFAPPETWANQLKFTSRESIRIRSLRNPDKKMSKSVEDPAGTIALSDSPEDAVKKIMGATTDSEQNIRLDWDNQPGISNLLQILALLSDKPLKKVVTEWEGKNNYGELKQAVANEVKDFLTELQTNLSKVSDKVILDKLAKDEVAMNKVASAKLAKVQKAIGLR